MKKIIIAIIIVAIIGLGGYFSLKENRKKEMPMPSKSNPSIPNNPASSSNSSIDQNTVNSSQISIKDFAFSPATLTVKAGTTVVWTNEDSATHNIKSDTFNSGNLNTGDNFQFKFSTSGTFDYSCGIHPFMKGTIVVQ